MSRLEELVPPLELCKQIPDGAFEDSALVYGNPMGWSPCLYPQLVTRDECSKPPLIIAPAPTLEEIMAAMARMEVCPGVDMLVNIKGEICGRVDAGMRYVSFCGKSTPSEAALKRWLDLNEGKIK